MASKPLEGGTNWYSYNNSVTRTLFYPLFCIVLVMQLNGRGDLSVTTAAALYLNFLLIPFIGFLLAKRSSKANEVENNLLRFECYSFGVWAGALGFPDLITFMLFITPTYALIILAGYKGVFESILLFVSGGLAAAMLGIAAFASPEGLNVEITIDVVLVLMLIKVALDSKRRIQSLSIAQQSLTQKRDLLETELRVAQELRLEREQLLEVLGHELKQPVSAGSMQVEMMKGDDTRQSKLRATFNEINMLVNNVLDMGKVENSSISLVPEIIDLTALLQDTAYRSSAPQRIDIQNADSPVRMCTDRFVMEKILKNLIQNAVDYGDSSTPVRVRIVMSKEFFEPPVSIYIYNRPGKGGFPDIDKVFTKYYRSSSTSHRSGSGLGLYIVQHLAEQMGCEVSYAPTPSAVCFKVSMYPLPPVIVKEFSDGKSEAVA